jgi:hypothetical protein
LSVLTYTYLYSFQSFQTSYLSILKGIHLLSNNLSILKGIHLLSNV